MTPPAPRAHMVENGVELRVVVPARRNWFVIIFHFFWLVGWAFGEVAVPVSFFMGEVGDAPALFMLVWFCGWTAGGAWALYLWCWNAKGREVTVVCDDTFSIRYEAFGMGKTWEFDPCAVRNLHVIGDNSPPIPAWGDWFLTRKSRRWDETGIWSGPLVFDYGAKTYRFGAGMDEAEARDLLPHLLRRLSPNDPPATPNFSRGDDR